MPKPKQELTDIPAEDEEANQKTAKKSKEQAVNPELSCLTREEAEEVLRESLRGLEKVYNWAARQNQSLSSTEQLNFMAVETIYKRRVAMRDGKAAIDTKGEIMYEEPSANIQIKLPLTLEAISLPLYLAVQFPGDN